MLWVDINEINNVRQLNIYVKCEYTKIITYLRNHPVKIDYEDIYCDDHTKLLIYLAKEI